MSPGSSASGIALLNRGTPALPPFAPPQVEEIGGTQCVVLRQDASVGSVSSVVLRGATEGQLDDVERAVDDGVNAFKVWCSQLLWGYGVCMCVGGGCSVRRLALPLEHASQPDV